MRNTTTYLVLLSLLLYSTVATASQFPIDSSWSNYEQITNYVQRIYLLDELANSYHNSEPDSVILFAEQSLQLAKILGHQEAEISSLNHLAYAHWKCEELQVANEYVQASLSELETIEAPLLQKETKRLAKHIGLTRTYVQREKVRISLLASKVSTLQNKGFAWQMTALSIFILGAIALWALRKWLTETYEDKLDQKETDIQVALEKVEASEKVQKELIHTISHEINTPMNAIVGFSELMMLPEMKEEEKIDFMESVRASCSKLARVTGSLLDYSILLADQLTVSKQTTDLEIFLGKIWKNNTPNADKKNLELLLSIPHTEEAVYYKNDIAKLEKILNELVDNAIKYTQKGKVTIGYTVRNRNLEFFVKDTGTGIAKSEQKNIFHQFKRGADNKYKTHGVGLGLTICKQLVEIMDGELYFNSRLTHGSTFYVRLPFYTPQSV